MIYLDTSYIIKCYVREPGSDAVLDLVESHPGRACSRHGRLEFWAAIHRHVRQGDLNPTQAQEIWRRFEDDEKDSLWSWLPVTEDVLASACSAYETLSPSIFLRSADALHLTSAATHGFREIYSNDRHLLEAAPHFGLQPCNVIS